MTDEDWPADEEWVWDFDAEEKFRMTDEDPEWDEFFNKYSEWDFGDELEEDLR
jgi:hypothetical protein